MGAFVRWVRRSVAAVFPSGNSSVGAECEAFVNGSSLALLQRSGLPVYIPSWVWVNVLAHGHRKEIEALTRTADRSLHHRGFGWPDCRAIIAAEIVESSRGSEGRLRELQRSVLQELERALFDRPNATPEDVARSALTALRAPHGG